MLHARRTDLALLSLSLAYFTLGVGSLAMIGLVQPMGRDLDASPAAIANLVSVYALAFALWAPASQVLLGHLPRRTVLLWGLAILSAASALGAFLDNYWAILATRVAMGLGGAMVGPMASAIGAGLVPPGQQGRALALVFSGMMLATVLGVPASAWLGALLGWRAVFLLIALAGVAAAVAVHRLVADRSAGVRIGPGALLKVLRARRSGLSVATTLLQMAAQFATYALIAPFLTERMGASPDWIAPMLLVFGVGGIAGNILAGRLSDRIGADRTVGVSLWSVALVFAVLAVAPAAIGIALPLMLLWAVAGTLFQAPQQQRLVQIDPAARGLLLASNAAALYLGMAAGSFLAGVTHHALGASALPLVSVALLGAAWWAFQASRASAGSDTAGSDTTGGDTTGGDSGTETRRA